MFTSFLAIGATSAGALQLEGCHIEPKWDEGGYTYGTVWVCDDNPPPMTGLPVLPVAPGEVRVVTTAADGTVANQDSYSLSWSPDGSRVAFTSFASLVVEDTNGVGDVYVKDLASGAVTRVSTSSSGAQASGHSVKPEWSPDSTRIAFLSSASDLAPGGLVDGRDIFVKDLGTGTTKRVTTTEAYGSPSSVTWSPDGTRIAFVSSASYLVNGDTNQATDVFVLDLATGDIARVSTSTSGTNGELYRESVDPSWSPDGTRIAFASLSSTLVAGDMNNAYDIFVKDLDTGETERVYTAINPDTESAAVIVSEDPEWSPDGTRIVFSSRSPETALGDKNGTYDIFVVDLKTGEVTLISRPVKPEIELLGDHSREPQWSPDGSRIAFWSQADNLTADDHLQMCGGSLRDEDVFVADLLSGEVTLVSSGNGGTQACGWSPSWSPDGTMVAFAAGTDEILSWNTDWFHMYVKRVAEAPPAGDGRFLDDDDSGFETDIEWLATAGITSGCNPPMNTMYCPNDPVTRGQMAAFLTRALDLPAAPTSPFTDDDGNIFETSIAALAYAGVTKGCNPPANDEFCPSQPVTRGQMAAFLVRALGYTDDGGGDLFTDDDASIFQAQIDRLATAGVTRGCNPPLNDRFCPNNNVTRAQMAAFLHRALGNG